MDKFYSLRNRQDLETRSVCHLRELSPYFQTIIHMVVQLSLYLKIKIILGEKIRGWKSFRRDKTNFSLYLFSIFSPQMKILNHKTDGMIPYWNSTISNNYWKKSLRLDFYRTVFGFSDRCWKLYQHIKRHLHFDQFLNYKVGENWRGYVIWSLIKLSKWHNMRVVWKVFVITKTSNIFYYSI